MNYPPRDNAPNAPSPTALDALADTLASLGKAVGTGSDLALYRRGGKAKDPSGDAKQVYVGYLERAEAAMARLKVRGFKLVSTNQGKRKDRGERKAQVEQQVRIDGLADSLIEQPKRAAKLLRAAVGVLPVVKP